MNFNELLQEVYTITNRPDLESETASAVRAATLKAHGTDFYSRDLFETQLQFQEKNYIQCVDLFQMFCNYRKIKYAKRYNIQNTNGKAIGPESGVFFEIITPEEVLDSYGRNRTDVAYEAGRNLNLYSSVDFQYMILGAYMYPIVTPIGDYSSWVAQLQPFAIINEAARVIYKMIGYDEQSAAYNTLVAEEYLLLKQVGLATVGE